MYNSLKELDELLQKSADIVKQLVESKITVRTMKSRLNKLDKKAFKEDMDLSDSIIKEIDELTALFLGKIDKRQGITRNIESNVQQKIYKAYSYISSRPNGNTVTEENLIKHANTSLEKATESVNEFFNERWKNYKSKIENLEYSEFKEELKFNLYEKEIHNNIYINCYSYFIYFSFDRK